MKAFASIRQRVLSSSRITLKVRRRLISKSMNMIHKFLTLCSMIILLTGCSTSDKLSAISAVGKLPFVSVTYNAAEKEGEYKEVSKTISNFVETAQCISKAISVSGFGTSEKELELRRLSDELMLNVPSLIELRARIEKRLVPIIAQRKTGDHDIKSGVLMDNISADILYLEDFNKTTKPQISSLIDRMNSVYRELAGAELRNGVSVEDRKLQGMTDCIVAAQ